MLHIEYIYTHVCKPRANFTKHEFRVIYIMLKRIALFFCMSRWNVSERLLL